MAEKMRAPRHALPCKVAMMTMQTTLSGLRICQCQNILGMTQWHCTYDRYASPGCSVVVDVYPRQDAACGLIAAPVGRAVHHAGYHAE